MTAKNTLNTEIEHLVFFWMKNPESDNDRKEFEKAIQKLLSTSVYLKNNHFGKPADIHRAVVDSSYTYCLKVNFENMEEHNKYQIEPSHKTFISEASKLWDRVLIYDSEAI